MNLTNLQLVLDAVVAFGVIIFGISQWRGGRNQLNVQTIDTYKQLLEATEKKYEAKQTDMQGQINTQSSQIGEMRGLIAGKDAQIADYRQIIENRNPNLEKILVEVVDFMKKVDSRLTIIAEHQQKPIVAETTIHK